MTIKLLSSHECSSVYHIFNSFENKYFGDDFRSHPEEMLHWTTSPNFFYNAVVFAENNNIKDILAVGSMLLTNYESYTKLIRGVIKENEIYPYSARYNSKASCIYYSSLIAKNRKYVKIILRSLFSEVKDKIFELNINPEFIFSIGCTQQGISHLIKSNYEQSNHYYLNKYPIFSLADRNQEGNSWHNLLLDNKYKCNNRIPHYYKKLRGKPNLLAIND